VVFRPQTRRKPIRNDLSDGASDDAPNFRRDLLSPEISWPRGGFSFGRPCGNPAARPRIDVGAPDGLPAPRKTRGKSTNGAPVALAHVEASPLRTSKSLTWRRAYSKDRNVSLGRVASYRAVPLHVRTGAMRRGLLVTVVALSAGALSVSCAFNPVMPDPRTPSDRARELEPRCADVPKDLDTEALSPSIIERVDPAYNYVQSGNDRVVRLRGARLRFKARRDLSSEALELSLECHQARVTLGRARELEHDPYALPGTWLDIDSHSAGDGFVVAVQVDDIARARAVLDRARQFVASRQ
jgi:hypothetical protein